MVKIRPFRAYIAHREYAEEISIPSNHSISVEEGSDYVRKNRNSFYKVDRPEFELSSIVKNKSKSNSTVDKNSEEMSEDKDNKDFMVDLPKKIKTESNKKSNNSYKRANTDFSKKFDGYEKMKNLKETGQEYREELLDLKDLKVSKEIKLNTEIQNKLKKNTCDDIEIVIQKRSDSFQKNVISQRKTSEKIKNESKTNLNQDSFEEIIQNKKIQKIMKSHDDLDLELNLNLNINENPEFILGNKNLNQLIQKQLYRYYDKEKLYLYVMKDKKRKNSLPQVGLICTIHYQEYKDKNIKVHEKTLSKSITRLKKLYNALGAYTGFPILFAEFGELYKKIHHIVENEENILKVSMDNVDHLVYQLPNNLDEEALAYFKAVKSVYVADGHHRLKAYTSLIDSYHNKSNPEFSIESIFVKDPNNLPVICRTHSEALIQKSMLSKENKLKMEKRNINEDKLSLIIEENSPNGKESNCNNFFFYYFFLN